MKLRLSAEKAEWFGKPALEISVFAEGTDLVVRKFEADNLGAEQNLIAHKQGLKELHALKKEYEALEEKAKKAGYWFFYADPADDRRANLLKRIGFKKPSNNYFWVKYLRRVS